MHTYVYIQQGLAGVTAQDWIADAEARLLTDQAVKVLSLHTALLNHALLSVPTSAPHTAATSGKSSK